jgi:predicted MFS family arabinose efflux permease
VTVRGDSVEPVVEVPAVTGGRIGPWAPLRHRVFFALFVAQMVSNVGSMMQNVGSAWVMGDLGASATLVALVQTATFLPVFIVGIPAGALADIVDRRRMLIMTQLSMVLASGALAVLAFGHHVTPAALLALTFALGAGSAFNAPAWMAIQPDLVPKRELSQAMALGSLTFNVGRAIGPAIGGLVLAALGTPWVFAINSISFVGTALVLGAWRGSPRQNRLPAESLAGATRAALRYALHAPVFGGVLGRVAALVVPAAALLALLPVVVRDRLHLGSGSYGVLYGAFGVGAALAAVLRPRFEERFEPDALVGIGTVVIAGVLLVNGLVMRSLPIGAVLVLGGVAWTTAFTTVNIAAQATLPAWVRARGMGIYMLVLAGGLAVGSAIWGAVADWSVRGAHVLAAAVLVGAWLGTHRLRLDRTVGVDVTPAPADEPVVMLTPRHDDGPVLVTVEYRVPVGEMARFVELMRGMERDRRRTGAYQWGLFRDLGVPDRFVETFLVDSWAEHLRQHERGTQAGQPRRDALRAFATGVDTRLVSAYSEGALRAVDGHGNGDDGDRGSFVRRSRRSP